MTAPRLLLYKFQLNMSIYAFMKHTLPFSIKLRSLVELAYKEGKSFIIIHASSRNFIISEKLFVEQLVFFGF